MASVLREDPAPAEKASAPVVAVKLLRPTDLPKVRTQHHEINVTPEFRRVFGNDRLEGKIRWLDCRGDSPQMSDGAFTWYDARARSAVRTGRSEWRFYYDGAFPSGALPGDTLLVAHLPDGRHAGAVLAAGSEWAAAGQALKNGDGREPSARKLLGLLG